jgi:hypothetical protein
MYNSLFGAGGGSGAFATDMLILDDIAQQEKARQKAGKSNCYNSVSAFDFNTAQDDDELFVDPDD